MRCNQVRYRVCKFTSAALRVIQHGLTGGVSAAKGQKHVRRHMCDNQHHCVCRWADVGTRFTPRCGPKAPKPPSHVLRTKLRKPHKMWLRIKAAGCNQARAASDEAGTRVAEPGKYQRRVCVMHLPLVWLTGDEDKSEDPQATTTIGATNPCGFCCLRHPSPFSDLNHIIPVEKFCACTKCGLYNTNWYQKQWLMIK